MKGSKDPEPTSLNSIGNTVAAAAGIHDGSNITADSNLYGFTFPTNAEQKHGTINELSACRSDTFNKYCGALAPQTIIGQQQIIR